jgi:hypothetical protein
MPNVVVLNDSVKTVAGLRMAGSGDPMFTPDQTTPMTAEEQATALTQQGERLAAAYGATPDRPPGADLVVVHEPPAATPLFGRVPLVLAGHTHQRREEMHDGTEFLVQGSTGGAGLRGLEHTTPTPLDLSVLYFDPTTKKLVAYDNLELGGLGLTSVDIQRHAVAATELHIPGTPLPTPPTAPPASPAPTPSTSESPVTQSPFSGLPSGSAAGSPTASADPPPTNRPTRRAAALP